MVSRTLLAMKSGICVAAVVLGFAKGISAERNSLVDITVDHKQGNFTILLNNEIWFESDDFFVRDAGRVFSTGDGSLNLKKLINTDGFDKIGKYNEYQLHYSTTLKTNIVNKIRLYANAIVFEQSFPSSLHKTSSGNADGLISGFPTFKVSENQKERGYAHWVSWFYEYDNVAMESHGRKTLVAPGFATPQIGKWNKNINMTGGVGGTGVVSVFDDRTSTAVVLSALTNPMALSHVTTSPGHVSFGIMGNVTEIPSDFSISTILYVGSSGVNKAVEGWGKVLCDFHGKDDAKAARAKDVTLQYLGYTTDNGAYYYYNTEPGQDYEQTLVGVKKYADSVGIPYKYVLLDSWWYYKGSNGGVSNWTALPSAFPRGIEALFNQTGWFVQAHNRYWSLDNHYAKSQGGDFEFIEDPVRNGAVPVQSSFWESIFDTPAKQWGLRVYEQDWLFNEFYEYVGPMLESVSLGRTWLLQMGEGAAKKGLTIQYCMPFIRHLLQSLEVPVATQARASDDYVVSPYIGVDNWRIGGQSLLIDALGMAPSKDGYWSTSYQANNPYGSDRYEPYPRLQAAVTAISAGPVAVADGINYSDAGLILKSCSADGRLLQPSSPATLIDAAFQYRAYGKAGPDGEVWFAPALVAGRRFGVIFVADLKADWAIRPADVGYPPNSFFYVYESSSTLNVVRWSDEEPLLLKACGYEDFALWTVVPVEPSGHAFLGETNKWVAISPARFADVVETPRLITASSTSDFNANKGIRMRAAITGTAYETVHVSFLQPDLSVVTASCMLGEGQTSVVIGSDGSCSLTM